MTAPPVRVAYLMSRFPKLSETFVVNEMLAVEAEGIEVEVFPLIHEREDIQQPAAAELVARAHFQPAISPRHLVSALAWALESPGRLASVVLEAIRGVWGSWGFVFGLVGILPKTLHNARVMRSLGVDHVHAHFAHHPALAALIIHRLTGIPFSFTGHGHDIQVDRRMLCHKIGAARFAVAISEFNRSLMLEGCGDGHGSVPILHTGVDPVALRPATPSGWARSRWSTDGLRVLAVGRLEEVKGHEVLIDATAELVRRDVDVQVLLVGDGPRHRLLEARSRELGVQDRVELVGPLPHDRVVDLMRSAHVVALPSVRTADGRVEGIPVVLMEAMSLGVPVVASDLPGVRELVASDDDGLRFAPGDPDALATALELVTDPAQRDRLSAGGRRRIIEAFDTRVTARELAARFRASAGAGDDPGGQGDDSANAP